MLDALTWFPDLPARPGRLAADLRVRPEPPLREPLIRKVGAPPWARGTLRFARLMRPSQEVMLRLLGEFRRFDVVARHPTRPVLPDRPRGSPSYLDTR